MWNHFWGMIWTSIANHITKDFTHNFVDAGATTPTARSMTSVIQTVHAFFVRRFSWSTSEILVRAGGGYFEHVVKRRCNLLVTTRLAIFETTVVSRVCDYSMIHYNVHI